MRGTSFSFGHKFNGGILLLVCCCCCLLLLFIDEDLLDKEEDRPESYAYVVFELLSVIELILLLLLADSL